MFFDSEIFVCLRTVHFHFHLNLVSDSASIRLILTIVCARATNKKIPNWIVHAMQWEKFAYFTIQITSSEWHFLVIHFAILKCDKEIHLFPFSFIAFSLGNIIVLEHFKLRVLVKKSKSAPKMVQASQMMPLVDSFFGTK